MMGENFTPNTPLFTCPPLICPLPTGFHVGSGVFTRVPGEIGGHSFWLIASSPSLFLFSNFRKDLPSKIDDIIPNFFILVNSDRGGFFFGEEADFFDGDGGAEPFISKAKLVTENSFNKRV